MNEWPRFPPHHVQRRAHPAATGLTAGNRGAGLVGRERDVTVLSELAPDGGYGKGPVNAWALTGPFTAHHGFLVRAMLDRLDAGVAMERRLSAEIDQATRRFRQQVHLFATILVPARQQLVILPACEVRNDDHPTGTNSLT
jgi:hypothetical protein